MQAWSPNDVIISVNSAAVNTSTLSIGEQVENLEVKLNLKSLSFPLKVLLSIPILIKSKDDINVTGIPSQKLNGTGAVFLIDSGKTGSTAPMVSIFMEKMKSEGFRKMISTQFIKHTNLCVDSFLNGDVKNLFDNTKKLSKIVLDNFKPMIPNEFHDLWKKGIDSGSYFLKLCGSGGGGYILGFAPNIEQAKNDLKDYNLEVVYHF